MKKSEKVIVLGLVITTMVAMMAAGCTSNKESKTPERQTLTMSLNTCDLIDSCAELKEECEELKNEYDLTDEELADLVDITYLYND